MVFVCPEKQQQRKSLLSNLKDLVNQIGDCCPPSCCMPPSSLCPPPACPPNPGACCPPCYSPCCPPCIPQCTPGTCPPKSATVPVMSQKQEQPICVPPILPICTPVPPPCVPICNPNPEEQPCVPCNPPAMMVCYRRPKNANHGRSKSRELRASVLHVGCDCEKHNGLQDDCLRSECHGSPECLSNPPVCGPSEFAGCKHLGNRLGYGSKDLESYQCYPAYIKLPTVRALRNQWKRWKL
ncbi:unnamed protein product [Acanthoscelides obtectus]|uniref:Uncharacterized protein n=1 Tax=Acanthoscelides obtectus TaxID=200917 RepID=A0A9P0LAB2_ACAOB|nr:unnamed protein product [Acanthoscelides obtectus]CAK1629619.1 hypothetical protein AOBTE_LOCUS5853 [Acanthoscelides obtectus]